MVIFSQDGEFDTLQLWEETESAIRRTERYTRWMRAAVKRYHGSAFSEESSLGEDAPENSYFEYVSLMIPRLIYDNPRIKVGTKRGDVQRLVARTIEHGLNRWIRDVRLRGFLSRGPVLDMLFSWGVVLIHNEECREKRKVKGKFPCLPRPYRVSPEDYFEDPQANSRDELRYCGHKYLMDKDDLLTLAGEGDGWNKDVIETLAVGASDKEDEHDAVFRNSIELREIWVPEIQTDKPEDGYNGTVYTIATSATESSERRARMVRDPKAFYGPRWGPYTVFGCYTVPDDTRPLAPLQAAEGQIQSLNEHTRAVDLADRRYKKFVMVDDPGGTLEKNIKFIHDGAICQVKGLTKDSRFLEAEVGGSSPTQANQVAVRRERVDRVLGMSDARRGVASGEGTATEQQIAADSSAARIDFVRQQVADATIQMLNTVAWYLYHDNKIIFPLGDLEDEQYQEIEAPWFQGGDPDEEEGSSYDDLELDIEPYSMERTTEGMNQQRAVQAMELLTNVAQVAPQAPYMGWKTVLDKIGNSMNMPEFAEVFNVEDFNRYVSMVLGAQLGLSDKEPSGSQPRLQSPSAHQPTRGVMGNQPMVSGVER